MPSTAELNRQLAVVKEKAKRAGVPWEVLWGVYGVETTHGANVSTSSAGAEGAFQFIPSTAREWHYPLTNVQTPGIFDQQAEAAANYLGALIKQHNGNIDAAVRAYSGGGYGEAQALKDAAGLQPAGSFPVIGEVVKGSALSKPAEAKTAIEGIASGFSWDSLSKFAITAVLLLAGAVLVVYGLMVAVRPREQALSMPFPKAVPVPV